MAMSRSISRSQPLFDALRPATTPSSFIRPLISTSPNALALPPSIQQSRDQRRYHAPSRISPLSRPSNASHTDPLSPHRHVTFHPTHRNPSTPPNHSFSTTPPRPRDHHFDTLKFVTRLRSEGFSEAQAKSLMRVLSDVIEESIQNLTRTMVLREDALKTSYTQKVDFAALRTELLNLDNAENSTTRSSHERLTNELQKLNNRLRDEIQRTQSSVRLDLNLEKGRIREESQGQELKIKETETRIEQEVAGLRERVEGVKFSTLQWLMGVCTGTAALLLGAWRLLT